MFFLAIRAAALVGLLRGPTRRTESIFSV
jgi:hypothetical protein